MHSSRDSPDDLLRHVDALQHERAPRPLPLFLELVRKVGQSDPQAAREALRGLNLYAAAPRPPARPQRPEVLRVGAASVRDHGGSGPPLLLVPSLINPPHVLDLDGESSLTDAIAAMGRRVLLLDWGPAAERSGLDVGGHVEHLLVPAIAALGEPPALAGYCLGGTMAIAAANLAPVERVATLAAPWRFAGYPGDARAALCAIWDQSKQTARQFGALPMEVLQAAFWSLDPERTVRKFADFAGLDPAGPEARRFVSLEDWANEGEPLPFAAARELIEDLFGADLSGRGEWRVGGRAVTDRIDAPLLNILANRDRIAPAATAARGEAEGIQSGHVGMVIGSARAELHAALRGFLAPGLAAEGGQG